MLLLLLLLLLSLVFALLVYLYRILLVIRDITSFRLLSESYIVVIAPQTNATSLAILLTALITYARCSDDVPDALALEPLQLLLVPREQRGVLKRRP